jgi:hypothetical protein
VWFVSKIRDKAKDRGLSESYLCLNSLVNATNDRHKTTMTELDDNDTVTSATFAKGDRVIVRRLTTSTELNGRHGIVAAAGLQVAVHLDILKTVILDPSHLDHEDTTWSSVTGRTTPDRVAVQNGALWGSTAADAAQAIKVQQLFHVMRWIAWAMQIQAKGGQNSQVTLSQMAFIPAEMGHTLNAYAMSNWPSVRSRLGEYARQNPAIPLLATALNDGRAMKSWHCGIYADFWFVGRDYQGTFVVPDRNKDVVYKIVGIVNQVAAAHAKQPGDAVSIIRVPMRLRITVVPWYGRLLHDTTVAPPQPDSVVYAGVQSDNNTDPPLATKLHSVVLQAIQAGRVIESLVELETNNPA